MKTNNSRVKAATLAVDRARFWVLCNSPFYAQLAQSLTDRIDASIPTACTNGKMIKWNPEFILGLNEREQRYVLLHETLHCAHGHLWRFPAGFCDEAAKQACDHAINLYLNASGLDIAMPKGGLADPKFKGMAEEEIAKALRKAGQTGQPKPDEPDPCGGYEKPAEQDGGGESGKPGDEADEDGQQDAQGADSSEDEDGDGESQGDGEKDAPTGQDGAGRGQGEGEDEGDGGEVEPMRDGLKEEWERRLVQAAQSAKISRGNLPGDLARAIDRVRAERIDWRQEVVDFVKDKLAERNDWSRPARRHAWQPVVYPRKRHDNIGLVVLVRDTSGSIGSAMMNAFNAQGESFAAELGCELLVLDCDDVIQGEYRVAPGEPMPKTSNGGGGTDFRPPFERVRELVESGEQIAGVLYLTDLYGPEPKTVDVPTLWVCVNERVASTGRTVRMEL